MSTDRLSRSELLKIVFSRLVAAFLILPALFFLPAGTLAFWEAWVFLAVLFLPMLLAFNYLLKNDPELLERRMRMRERVMVQKWVIALSILYLVPTFLLPGFDRRYEWSQVPVMLVVLADILVLLGYGLFFLVLKENSYASRIIEVEQEQKVISSGPYAFIRHPMYLGVMIMYLMYPLALGSYWTVIPSLLIIPLLVIRVLNEEEVLARELKGYQEYMQKVKYRLIPGIW